MIVYANGRLKGTTIDGETSNIGAVGINGYQLNTADMVVRELLTEVISQLKILNLHMSMGTDAHYTVDDVEGL